MANPKRRTSRARQGERRSHLALKPIVANHCGRCGALCRPHRVCDNCGFYRFEKGKQKGGMEVLPRQEF
jgi:large subunit ribosomal protein L32